MKIKNRFFRLSSVAIAIGASGMLPSLNAQFMTSFEASEGYTNGQSILGVNDSSIPGSATWTNAPWSNGVIASSAHPQTGELALRIQGTGTGSAFGANLDLSESGVSFTTSPIHFSLGISIAPGFSPDTGNQLQIYLGSVGAGDSAKHWLTLMFSDGNFFLYDDQGTWANARSIGAYTTVADYGSYITFDAIIDPVSKTYISGTITGNKGMLDFTDIIAGRGLPWKSAEPGDPAPVFTVLVGGNDIITVDIDNFGLRNIPESSTYAIALGMAGLILAVALRRRR